MSDHQAGAGQQPPQTLNVGGQTVRLQQVLTAAASRGQQFVITSQVSVPGLTQVIPTIATTNAALQQAGVTRILNIAPSPRVNVVGVSQVPGRGGTLQLATTNTAANNGSSESPGRGTVSLVTIGQPPTVNASSHPTLVSSLSSPPRQRTASGAIGIVQSPPPTLVLTSTPNLVRTSGGTFATPLSTASNLMSGSQSSTPARKRMRFSELQERAPPNEEIGALRKKVLENKVLKMRIDRERYAEHASELFFLQAGGNMMDYHTWRKRPPTPQFLHFLRSHRLDPDDDDEDLTLLLSAASTSGTMQSSQSTEIKIPGVGATPVAISTTLPPAVAQLNQQGGTPLVLEHSVPSNNINSVSSGTGRIPPVSSMSSPEKSSVAGSSPSKLNKLPMVAPMPRQHTRQHSISAVYDNSIGSQEQIAEKAKQLHLLFCPLLSNNDANSRRSGRCKKKSVQNYYKQRSLTIEEILTELELLDSTQVEDVETFDITILPPDPEYDTEEAYVMQRISELQREGLWSEKRLPKVQEPSRSKAHWDYLLEEMIWLAADFAQERKWKKAAAKKCARNVQKHFQEKAIQAQKAEKVQELRLKKIAGFIAKEVKTFWSNVEKLVEYKQQTRLEEKRKKALDQHLSFIVDQTEKYSTWLAESMNKTGTDSINPSVPASMNSSRISSPTRQAENEMSIEDLIAKYGSGGNTGNEMEDQGENEESDVEDEDDGDENEESESSSEDDRDSIHSTEGEMGLKSLLDVDNENSSGEKVKDNEAKGKEISDVAALAESIQPTGNTLSSTSHTLREYQHIGLDWLVTMFDRKLNGILADEMGLGNWGPHLIIVPTSVMLNWEMELKKWCPAFKILTYYGSQKERKQKRTGWTKPNAFHVCITSYKLVIQDHQSFRRKKWKYLILDEAQNIKNFKSQRWQLLLNFQTQRTRETLASGNLLSVINVLMQLRKVCNHPNLFEVRPTISPFQMEGITFETASLVMSALDYDPFKVRLGVTLKVTGGTQLQGYSVQLVHHQGGVKAIPFSMGPTSHSSQSQVQQQQQTFGVQVKQADGVQRFSVPAGFAQLVQTSTGRHILLTPSAQVIQPLSQNPGTTTVTTVNRMIPSSQVTSTTAVRPVMRVPPLMTSSVQAGIGTLVNTIVTGTTTVTTTTTMTSTKTSTALTQPVLAALVQQSQKNNSSVTSSIVTRNDSKVAEQRKRKQEMQVESQSVFYLKRMRRKAKLEMLNRLNHRRCAACPIYGSDLTESMRFVDLVESSSGDWKGAGYVHCLNTIKQDSKPGRYWTQTNALRSIIHAPEQYVEELRDIFSRFVLCVPAVSAPLPKFHVSHPPPSKFWAMKRTQAMLQQELSSHSALLHPIASAMVTQFPDPRLIQYDCGKLQVLDRLLRQLKAGHHRVLIFTQMTRMLDVLEAFLNFHGHIYLRLDGTTRVDQRQILMERFNADRRIFCFILSTRSGGIGVNLTGADTVIFYDSDWNPTMDAQAQDRCHRIGQTRDVHIYRLVSEKTVEENILKKANQKRLLGDLAIEGGNFTTAYFKSSTIQDLFNIDVAENDASRRMAEVLDRENERESRRQKDESQNNSNPIEDTGSKYLPPLPNAQICSSIPKRLCHKIYKIVYEIKPFI
ncbi:hypothetical protein C0J52_18960 [Blattella germanica]|nr:hypothetical protein C0J52_18960 [Blattella germanica]